MLYSCSISLNSAYLRKSQSESRKFDLCFEIITTMVYEKCNEISKNTREQIFVLLILRTLKCATKRRNYEDWELYLM
jgi:hypothetical protein